MRVGGNYCPRNREKPMEGPQSSSEPQDRDPYDDERGEYPYSTGLAAFRIIEVSTITASRPLGST